MRIMSYVCNPKFSSPSRTELAVSDAVGRRAKHAATIHLHFTLTLIERFLDTVSPVDYRILVETLQPEMVKAKRLTTGKQITAVSPPNPQTVNSVSLTLAITD